MALRGVVVVVTISVLLMKCFLIVPSLRHRAPPLWGPRSIPNDWADVCGFVKPPASQRFWKVNKTWCHGAFSIPRQALGLRPSDQSRHHDTWLHLHFVDWNNKWNHEAHFNGNLRLKEQPASVDHSLSSWVRNHLHSLILAVPLLTITKWPDDIWRQLLVMFPPSRVFVVSCSSRSSCARCQKKFYIIEIWKPWWKDALIRKLRARNFDARHWRIESGAVVVCRKGWITSGRKKPEIRKESDVVSATRPKILRKNPQHTAATQFEPTVSPGRSVSKKRSIRGKGNLGSTLRQPCKHFSKGTCMRTSCE